ncbi:CHAT domain-containing protein [Silvimonas iriomotensis]|nr:CHAT domain-containing protein [Silvimonas iriomotensis]
MHITDDDDLGALVSLFFDLLPSRLDDFPGLADFVDVVPDRRSTTEAARKMLSSTDADHCPPLLIILDGRVLASKNAQTSAVAQPESRTGEAATGFLGWLKETNPDIPVLVQMPTSLEKLELKVLSRPNVALLTLNYSGEADAHGEFMEVISNLFTPDRPRKRRITIDVGSNAATYHFRMNRYEFVTEAKAYLDKGVLPTLVHSLNAFTPWNAGQSVRPDWKFVLNSYGNTLFNVLINDMIGPHLEAMWHEGTADAEADPAAELSAADVELRFDINGEDDDAVKLFSLPFELASPRLTIDPAFLCANIPMARRIHMPRRMASARNRVQAPPHPPSVLFVHANASGPVSFVFESTGERSAPQRLDELDYIDAELAVLETIWRDSGGMLLSEPVVVGREQPERLVGKALINRIKAMLQTKAFDIVHFSGHSTSLPDGSTYLVLPGDEGEPYPVSVREFAHWVEEGDCKLVVLSSCRGSSLRSAIEIMRGGAEAVLGFRWEVDEHDCTEYFEQFYEAYLRRGRPFSQAYRDACRATQRLHFSSPLWASAVAVVRD